MDNTNVAWVMLIRSHKLVDELCDLVIQKSMNGKEMIEQLAPLLPACNYQISRVKVLFLWVTENHKDCYEFDMVWPHQCFTHFNGNLMSLRLSSTVNETCGLDLHSWSYSNVLLWRVQRTLVHFFLKKQNILTKLGTWINTCTFYWLIWWNDKDKTISPCSKGTLI